MVSFRNTAFGTQPAGFADIDAVFAKSAAFADISTVFTGAAAFADYSTFTAGASTIGADIGAVSAMITAHTILHIFKAILTSRAMPAVVSGACCTHTAFFAPLYAFRAKTAFRTRTIFYVAVAAVGTMAFGIYAAFDAEVASFANIAGTVAAQVTFLTI